jgi:hypothetical protein
VDSIAEETTKIQTRIDDTPFIMANYDKFSAIHIYPQVVSWIKKYGYLATVSEHAPYSKIGLGRLVSQFKKRTLRTPGGLLERLTRNVEDGLLGIIILRIKQDDIIIKHFLWQSVCQNDATDQRITYYKSLPH